MIDAAHLTLVQWLSAGFPLGGYAYSQGLEWAIEAGDVHDAGSTRQWLSDLVLRGAGRTDAILLALALQTPDPAPLAAEARALAPSAERLAETMDLGRALLATTNALTGGALPAMPYPVAFGAVARPLGLPVETVVALFLQAFLANLVQIAVRFVPLGQTEGQVLQTALQPEILGVAKFAARATLDDIGSATLRADLAAMHHETMDVRIFRT